MNYATLDDLKQLLVVSFDDFKQFVETTVQTTVETTVGQSEARLEAKMSAGFAAADAKTEALREDMNAGFAGVGDAFSQLNDHIDKKDRQTSKRLARLEAHPA